MTKYKPKQQIWAFYAFSTYIEANFWNSNLTYSYHITKTKSSHECVNWDEIKNILFLDNKKKGIPPFLQYPASNGILVSE